MRHKDASWSVPDKVSMEQAMLCVLMDIRDELKSLNTKAGCYRIPRALDDLHSIGVAARRRRKKARK